MPVGAKTICEKSYQKIHFRPFISTCAIERPKISQYLATMPEDESINKAIE